MNFHSRHPNAAIVCFAAAAVAGASAFAQSPAPGQPLPLDFQMLEKGKDALNDQKYGDAVAAFEQLIKKYPTSAAVPETYFRLGYAQYLMGDYDKSVESFKKAPTIKGASPEITELSLSLAPQVIAAKAAKMKPDDTGRDAVLKDAIQQFDLFLQKFPQSEEAESTNFGKAVALFQLKDYDGAAAALRINLRLFAQSETVGDSQYTLALVLGADGVAALKKATAPDPAAIAKLDESEKLLRDIINRRQNLALMNDAQFQLGELLNARGAFTHADQDKEARATFFKRALECYRAVSSKEQVLQAQKARVENISQRRVAALKAANVPLWRRLQRVQEKEQEKLAALESRTDQTLTAKLKSAQVFFQLRKMDEARVLLTFLAPFEEDPENKKQTAYFITLTYALQSLMDKAVEHYDAFQKAYKGDEIAENLQLVMAAGFLNDKMKAYDPEKAIAYCKEGLELYPKGQFSAQLTTMQASALIGMKRYDDALATLQTFLSTNSPKDLAAEAEFNLAIIYKDTGKAADALKTFKEINTKYAGAPQAETSAYWLGELGLQVDPKSAVPELKSFLARYPKSELAPQAAFALGRGQVALNQIDDGLLTLRDLAEKFPKSAPAPFSYFERAKILANRQSYGQCLDVMKEFVDKFPDSELQFQAYDFMAQILTSQKKGEEAVGIYRQFVERRPQDPAAPESLLKISALWKGLADAQGPYLSHDQKKREDWTKGMENSVAASEEVLTKFPDSPSVALALSNLLDLQKMRLQAHLITDADVEKYFADLAAAAKGNASLESKIQFTIASFVFQKDKEKARGLMDSVYKPELKYAPQDIDLYGSALLESKEVDKALAVYEKLGADYPIPTGVAPAKASRETQEAQAIALAGQGKALQVKGDKEGGGKKFQELEANYSWSPKMLEVNYGIAIELHEKKQDEDALKRLLDVVKAVKAPAELRANAMLLMGKIHEDNKRFDAAIDNYIKIATFYGGVPEAAAEGLWRGAQLLEKQGTGEIPMPTPAPRAAAAGGSK